MKAFIIVLTIGCLALSPGIACALCVDYDGDGNCDATGSVGDVPMPSNPTPVDTSGSSSGSTSTRTTSTTRTTSATRTVQHSASSDMNNMVATTVVGSVMGAVFSDLFSPPAAPAGPTPEELEAQRKLEEQRRREFQRSNAALAGRLRGSGTAMVEDKNVSESGGLKLKTIAVPATQASSAGGGETHNRLFGEGNADPAKVGLLREPMPSAGELSDPAAWKKAISSPDLTQEERERLILQRHVNPRALEDHPMVDSRALVEKERWTDPYLDIASAGAKAGAETVGGGLIEEGGKRYLKALGGADAGYDELLSAGKTGIDRPSTTAEKVFAVGDYALTKAPTWTIAVDGATNAVGAGTRQAIVRYWASKDSQKYYDPTPVATAKEKWNSWVDDQNDWSKAALDRVGAGKFE